MQFHNNAHYIRKIDTKLIPIKMIDVAKNLSIKWIEGRQSAGKNRRKWIEMEHLNVETVYQIIQGESENNFIEFFSPRFLWFIEMQKVVHQIKLKVTPLN